MDNVTLGNSSLEVSPLCFGCNVFGWTADQEMSFKLLDAFTNAGLNFIDTADVYSTWAHDGVGGQSESIIGNWLQKSGRREDVIIATKVGNEVAPGKKGLTKEYIMQAVEDSLQRLKTDYIDLYQSHNDDKDTPLEETLEAYHQLIKDGKVRVIGASNYEKDRLDEALDVSDEHDLPSYQSLQPRYNLYDRKAYEENLETFCMEHQIGVIPYFSLASGFLAGKYRSKDDLKGRKRGDFVKDYLDERGFKILDALDNVANQHDASPVQIALAWLMNRPSITAPIASATDFDQLHELIEAVELELSVNDITKLDEASDY